MARSTRYRIPNVAQLVYQRGHNGGVIFAGPSDTSVFVAALTEGKASARCEIHAYALLRDSIYILCTPSTDTGISKLMQSAGTRYAVHYNATYGRRGSIWEGRYRATLVQSGGHVLSCYLFVDSLLADRPADVINASSCNAHVGCRADPLLEEHWAYRRLANDDRGRQRVYSELLERGLPGSTQLEIRRAIRHNLVLGTETFKDQVAELGRGRVRLKRTGRPSHSMYRSTGNSGSESPRAALGRDAGMAGAA